MVDESTLNLTVKLHGTTQTRSIILPKATGDAVIALNNVSCHCIRPFTIVWHQSCPESNTNSFGTFREKTRPDTHKPKHSIENTPAPNIVHFSTTPRPCSRIPLLSSQINKQPKIHRFRPVLPSSFCISLWPSRRAVLSRRHPMFKDGFLPQRIH